MKRVIIPVAAFIAGMAIVPSVFASENSVPITEWYDANGLAACLSKSTNATCTLEGDVKTSDADDVATITKDMVLDLDGHTLTIEGTYGAEGTAFNIQENASLTITNGIVINEAGAKGNINVGKNASLTIDANVKTGVSATEASSVVLGAGRVLEGGLDVTGPEGDADFGTGATTVEINGQLKGAYTQTNNVSATINGSISATNANAITATGGALTLNGATINATGAGNAIVLKGADGSLTIKCSTITSADHAALHISGTGANVASLTVKNSTLVSTNGNTITGSGTVETVTIDGSHFEAKSDAKVKSGTTVFTHATYDGRVLGDDENVLAAATGSYGTLVACDTDAADKGEDTGEEAENPNTADTIATYLTIATVALLGLGATAFVAKKSNR